MIRSYLRRSAWDASTLFARPLITVSFVECLRAHKPYPESNPYRAKRIALGELLTQARLRTRTDQTIAELLHNEAHQAWNQTLRLAPSVVVANSGRLPWLAVRLRLGGAGRRDREHFEGSFRPFGTILVTNAPLFLAHDSFSTRLVKKASDLHDLADHVPYLSLFVETPPAFEKHAKRPFGPFRKVEESTNLREADEHKKTQGVREDELPSSVALLLSAGVGGAALRSPFSQIVVCQAAALNDLVGIVKAEVLRLNRSVSLRKPRAGLTSR